MGYVGIGVHPTIPLKVGWKVARHKQTPNSFKNGLFLNELLMIFFANLFFNGKTKVQLCGSFAWDIHVWSDSKQLKSTMKTWKLKKNAAENEQLQTFLPPFRVVGLRQVLDFLDSSKFQQWHVSLEMLLALVSSPLWLLTHPWKRVPWRFAS